MIKQLEINGLKSYDDFGVYISSRKISQPKKKSIKESIPFSNVVYDFSNLNGEIYWEERSLEYVFDIAEISTEEMENVKSRLLDWFMNVHDVDIYDPYIGDYHFHGSFESDSWDEDFGSGFLTVSFTVYPYKISNEDVNVIDAIEIDGKFGNVINKNLYNYEDIDIITSDYITDNDGWITISYDNSDGTTTEYFNYWTKNLNLKENTKYKIFIEVKEVIGMGKIYPISYLGDESGQFSTSSEYDFNKSIFTNQVKQNIQTTKNNLENVKHGLRTYVEFKVGESGSITFRLSVIEDTTIDVDDFVYRKYGITPIFNNSSHRIAPIIEIDGQLTITFNNKSYSLSDGVYENVLYLEKGMNEISLNGTGTISFKYKEERF